jgi:hypothetical protein
MAEPPKIFYSLFFSLLPGNFLIVAPRSRRNPQHIRDVLPFTLEEFQLGYEHIQAFGGLRRAERDIAPNVNGL